MSHRADGPPNSYDRTRATRLADAVGATLRRVSFWGAVLLPFVSLPLLSGVAGDRPRLLGGLLAVNVVCLRIGHGYER